jgi:hypothetical protein
MKKFDSNVTLIQHLLTEILKMLLIVWRLLRLLDQITIIIKACSCDETLITIN